MQILALVNYNDKLTSGKTYKLIYGYMGEYLIINDIGEREWYDCEKFINLEEHRTNQLDKILELLDY
jgi:hypothetical protein